MTDLILDLGHPSGIAGDCKYDGYGSIVYLGNDFRIIIIFRIANIILQID